MATLAPSENVTALLERSRGYLATKREERKFPEGVDIARSAGWLLISADCFDEKGRDVIDRVRFSPDGDGEIYRELCDSDSWAEQEKIGDQEALVAGLLDRLPPAA